MRKIFIVQADHFSVPGRILTAHATQALADRAATAVLTTIINDWNRTFADTSEFGAIPIVFTETTWKAGLIALHDRMIKEGHCMSEDDAEAEADVWITETELEEDEPAVGCIYCGFRDDDGAQATWARAEAPNVTFKLDPRYDLANHSPDGFEWGYGGSGPAQLALAILAHHYRTLHPMQAGEVMSLYQDFKFGVIGKLPRDADWTMTSQQIDAWVKGHMQVGEPAQVPPMLADITRRARIAATRDLDNWTPARFHKWGEAQAMPFAADAKLTDMRKAVVDWYDKYGDWIVFCQDSGIPISPVAA